MYVIWRKRKRAHYAGWHSIGDVRLTPIIVQSRRVNGKPKQEHIACLPSIIESHISNNGAVWFWTAVEEQLARLTNRIPREDMEKIRAALDKVVPQPDPEYVKNYEDEWRAEIESMAAALGSNNRVRETNRQMYAFSSSFQTAQACADCGGEMEEVYRERRTWKHRGAVGVLCKKCARGGFRRFGPHRFRHFGPCETCEREVFISRSIPALRSFCSTHCGQAHYRKARRLVSANRS